MRKGHRIASYQQRNLDRRLSDARCDASPLYRAGSQLDEVLCSRFVLQSGEERMRVRYTERTSGPGPSEAIVTIRTADGGNEEVIVDERSLSNDTITVGQVMEKDNTYLIELPQESVSGSWRLWVPASDVET